MTTRQESFSNENLSKCSTLLFLKKNHIAFCFIPQIKSQRSVFWFSFWIHSWGLWSLITLMWQPQVPASWTPPRWANAGKEGCYGFSVWLESEGLSDSELFSCPLISLWADDSEVWSLKPYQCKFKIHKLQPIRIHSIDSHICSDWNSPQKVCNVKNVVLCVVVLLWLSLWICGDDLSLFSICPSGNLRLELWGMSSPLIVIQMGLWSCPV